MSIKEEIETLKREFLSACENARNLKDYEDLRVKYLSRSGKVAALFKLMGQLSQEERPQAGKSLQELRAEIQVKVDELIQSGEMKKAAKPMMDPTLPGRASNMGGLHPITRLEQEIITIFLRMGFSVERGPEVESTFYNFDQLNTPLWHPARDKTDTFYLRKDLVLRTETSPIQVRVMERKAPPVRFIAPGRVYRNDKPDASHSPMFNQVEGLYVDSRVTFTELKGTLLEFYRAFLGADTKIRFRPHYFPFTEPSAEVDVSCVFCSGKRCRVCKNSGWMEMGGSGMVHPNVFRAVNKVRGDEAYDPEKVSGFAFGLGIDRLAMNLFGIDDIRMLYENDLRMLRQLA
ncbi:phenylalanine--tRNA ligase subunit alpha [bacterium]|nr:phenylalanine--tRNA ligase subunit alpha [bacterium]